MPKKSPEAVIAYWRDCLVNAEQRRIPRNRLAENFVDSDDVRSGCLPKDITERLFRNEARKRKKGGRFKKASSALSVLVAPAVLKARVTQQVRWRNPYATVIPLWMPAILSKSGRLQPIEGRVPWVPREVLDPQYTDHPTMGHVTDLDAWLASDEETSWEGWEAYGMYASRMSEAAFGEPLLGLVLDGYSLISKCCVVVDDFVGGASFHIQRLYDAILRLDSLPPLLQTYASLDLTQTRDCDLDTRDHLGQMSAAFPLGHSQREALRHFLSLKNGEMLAVNGPPGVGKTTWLQSVVATTWVEAALREEHSPIIVVSSTNNQAVTNVIHSFAHATDRGNQPLKRWLPDLAGFALFCPSKSRIDAGLSSDIPYTDENGKGFFKALESSTYLEEARTCFLKQSAAFLKRDVTINEALKGLHILMKKGAAKIRERYQLWAKFWDSMKRWTDWDSDWDVHALENKRARYEKELNQWVGLKQGWLATLAARSKLKTFFKRQHASWCLDTLKQLQIPINDSFDATNEKHITAHMIRIEKIRTQKLYGVEAELKRGEKLKKEMLQNGAAFRDWDNENGIPDHGFEKEADQRWRFDLFQLAVHYWEGRWLQACEAFLEEKEEPWTLETRSKMWRRFAMLTPCLVSTFHILPKFFSAEKKPMLEYIDLLIVDEAGQVSPEIAAPSFALAKKAVVVGDIHQIQPIWSLIRGVDMGNLKLHGLIEEKSDTPHLEALGVTVSSGSLMHVAQKASPFKLEDLPERGMFLSEHRRCVPEIIGFCNQLAYSGKLELLKPSIPPAKRILPAMGYGHIPANSEQRFGSRLNPAEAAAIAQWLEDRQDQLETHYDAPLEEIVAIVTPFAGQKRELRQVTEHLGDITIGTVHALQGAERPVILFSPVYGDKDRCTYFFDQDVNMLNVAVSRARESFLVFGNMNIFKTSGHAPSNILARDFLFAHPDNELTDITIPERGWNTSSEAVSIIKGTEEHERYLIQGFRKAEDRLLIASPFLSIQTLQPLESYIKGAVESEVHACVFTDDFLNRDGSALKPNAQRAAKLLHKWGVQLIVLDGIHNKTLCVDNHVLIEGSFNWLAAARSGRYRRYERSICYVSPENPQIHEMIDDVWEDLSNFDRLEPWVVNGD